MWMWMQITKDKYQLPICFAYSVKELASMVGKKPNVIESVVSKYENGKQKKTPFIRVWLDDKEEE